MNQTPDELQDQIAAVRRAHILAAATRVFAQRGFHRTTIRDVAKAANVADGTIYNYFANKNALLLGIMNRLNESDRRDDDLAVMAGGDIREFFRQYFAHRLAAFTQDGLEIFQVVLSEVLVNAELRELYVAQVVTPTFALAEAHFAQLVASGAIRPLNPRLALRVQAAAFLGLMILRIMDDPALAESWDDLPDQVTALFLDGLLPNAGGTQ
jgi:AcrR family transcriptional regulator